MRWLESRTRYGTGRCYANRYGARYGTGVTARQPFTGVRVEASPGGGGGATDVPTGSSGSSQRTSGMGILPIVAIAALGVLLFRK